MSFSKEQLVFWIGKILKIEFDSMFSDYIQKNAVLEELEIEGLVETSTYYPAGTPPMKILGIITSKGLDFAKNNGLI